MNLIFLVPFSRITPVTSVVRQFVQPEVPGKLITCEIEDPPVSSLTFEPPEPEAERILKAVSYTHLDVYKRQCLH